MTDSRGSGASAMVRAYVEMTKPRIIELLLITTVPAMAVAAGGWPGIDLILFALVGGALSAGGANVINQVYDDDIDRIMARTSRRPLPTDRIDKRAAAAFGIALGALGFVVLAVGTTLLAAILSVVAYLFYVFVYTMTLKRTTTQNIVIGGAAGAVPTLIGWAAVTGDLSLAAWIMFAIVFFWTPPHFWALSLKYEDDYRAARIPMMPVIAGERATFDLILWYSVVTVGMSFLVIPIADLGWIYALIACGVSIGMIGYASALRSDRSRAMRYFGFTNVYLAALFLAMMVDRVVLDSSLQESVGWIVAGAVATLFGMAMVITVERGPGMRAPSVSAVRHAVEVGATATFALVIAAAALVTS
ncbi:MAG: heme o synthase [Acidimicrobiia bacterium]